MVQEAEGAERSQPPLVATCHAIVGAVIGLGIEDMDRKRTWVADAEEMQKRGSIETARAILAHARDTFKTKKGLWRRSAQLEKAHGTRESLDALLRDAVKYCPQVGTPPASSCTAPKSGWQSKPVASIPAHEVFTLIALSCFACLAHQVSGYQPFH